MGVLGEPPHPQVLFAGFEEDDPAYLAMSDLVPSHRLMPSDGFESLRAVEWDVLVARNVAVDAPGFMHVLAMGCQSLGMAPVNSSGGRSVQYGGAQPSAVLHVPDDLPDALRRLVIGELVPWLQEQPARPYMTTWSSYGGGVAAFLGEPTLSRRPFVREADGGMIAGAFERYGLGYGGGWCWALPFVPAQPHLWLAQALRDWHDRTPQRGPLLPGWRNRTRWTTQPEKLAEDALQALRREHEESQRRFEVQELTLLAAHSAAQAAADLSERRLLTAQDKPLVDAVADALRRLGFSVIDVDEDIVTAPGQPKVEDLRVIDAAHPGWTNITEVKGYRGGAKASDFQRLGRFATLYAMTAGQPPGSCWYVVNQFLESDPDTRRPVLAGSDEDIAVFAEVGGLVIDTRELFRLLRLVQDGAVTQEDARDCLRTKVGVLRPSDYDPEEAG